MTGFALFDTALGTCGILWTGHDIAAVAFPGAGRAATAAALRRRNPDAQECAATPDAQIAIDGIGALLRGEPVDLSGIPVDFGEAPGFNRRVYDIARSVPAGETLTYGEVAERLGNKGAAQAVGKALGENPVPIIVPCHRVLAKGGRTGGFSAPGGVETKMRILSIEARHGPRGLFDELPMKARSRP